ncbi:hypothetical protein DH2020_000207 [Rehmannia glutinosa]|uniref:Uncharacterized protein n=1 Tax=Rehmannia glutinosa TaxID=99300 RepID=A0ABR0XW85_REHGL
MGRFSDAVSTSPRDSDYRVQMPTTPTPSSSGLRLPKHSSKSSKNVCAICLSTMKPGNGHAIFTGECSHSFHFHCIASNVKHGKQSCPVCRAKWKEIPLQSSNSTDKPLGRARLNNLSLPQDDASTHGPLRLLPSPRAGPTRQIAPLFHSAEPVVFDDDDEVASNPNISSCKNVQDGRLTGAVEVKTYPEVSAVPKSKSHDNFSILIHLKAPISEIDGANSQVSRAPVDLVTVLDVSGSMAGTKLALLKRAMGFVIQNLGPSDRLSVIAFSSTARRLFPLRRMTDNGRHEALQAVNSLTSNGGTNIAEGLRKAAKVLTDCKWKNPINSIILLSDGQDTYTNRISPSGNARSDYQSLLPVSMHRNGDSGFRIPIHAFGFGADHDAVSMHLISENSGGTFSFIEAESVIQDAFAQCIGGLLSVVVQELKVEVECVDRMLRLVSIKSGSYKSVLASDKRKATIEVRCYYKHPVSKDLLTLETASDVQIQRPVVITGPLVVSMEVDKQRNRLRSAEAMSEARAAARAGGDLKSAVSVLENCRKQLSETVSARAGDRLCAALGAELRKCRSEWRTDTCLASGRAYVLSGLSSHSWQRATARGDSTDSTSLVHAYQTPSMVDMVNLSQTMLLGNPHRRTMRPTLSFPARPRPR